MLSKYVNHITDYHCPIPGRQPVDILAHSFGTAVASALIQKLEVHEVPRT